jgi:cytochrome c
MRRAAVAGAFSEEVCSGSPQEMRPMQTIALAFGFALAAASAHADGDAARGAKLFEECAACHKLEPTGESVGPDLHGLFGRKAGEGADFRYSPALKRSGIAWNEQSIDKFIADPQAAVPGNRMPFAGIADAAARADLIAYLAKTFR